LGSALNGISIGSLKEGATFDSTCQPTAAADGFICTPWAIKKEPTYFSP